MVIFMKSREAARKLVQARKANNYPARVVDHGKEASKRFAVSLKG